MTVQESKAFERWWAEWVAKHGAGRTDDELARAQRAARVGWDTGMKDAMDEARSSDEAEAEN